jgi:hypothetical protein
LGEVDDTSILKTGRFAPLSSIYPCGQCSRPTAQRAIAQRFSAMAHPDDSRPRGRRAAGEHDEIAAPPSITSAVSAGRSVWLEPAIWSDPYHGLSSVLFWEGPGARSTGFIGTTCGSSLVKPELF